jgi:hypothetical protein
MSCFAKKLTELVFPANTFKQIHHHQYKRLFDDIYGCDNIKRLFRMALQSKHTTSILLSGPSASAKTLFLQSLMKPKYSCFIDCSNATESKSIRDCIRVAKLAKSIEDVKWIVNVFLKDEGSANLAILS